jgi:hypothetical protein
MNEQETEPTFTADDMSDWKAYERVRKGGRYNMFDPRARRATGLSGERYKFVMRHFSELKDVILKQDERT